MFNVVAAKFQIPPNDVKDQRRHGMTNVRVVVNCDATHVHLDKTWLKGFEVFFFASEGVV
jgi:hypothetical protein